MIVLGCGQIWLGSPYEVLMNRGIHNIDARLMYFSDRSKDDDFKKLVNLSLIRPIDLLTRLDQLRH